MKKLLQSMKAELGHLGFVDVTAFKSRDRSVFIELSDTWIARYCVIKRFEHEVSSSLRLAQPEMPDARINSRIGWTIPLGEFWGGEKHINEYCEYVKGRIAFLSPALPLLEQAIVAESESSRNPRDGCEFTHESSEPHSILVGGLRAFEMHCPKRRIEEIKDIALRSARGEIGYDHIGHEISKAALKIKDQSEFQNPTFQGKSLLIGRRLEPFYFLQAVKSSAA